MKAAHDTVDRVAYEILDEIVCPVVGIRGVWADITRVEISTYLERPGREATRQRKEIITRIAKRYGASEYALAQVWAQPLALVALVAAGRSSYRSYGKDDKKLRELTADDAWKSLAYRDERLRSAQVVRAKVVSVKPDGVLLKAWRQEIMVSVADVAWGKDVKPAKYAKVGEQLDVTILRSPVTDYDVKPYVTSPAAGWLPWPKEKPKKIVSRKVARRRALKRARERREKSGS